MMDNTKIIIIVVSVMLVSIFTGFIMGYLAGLDVRIPEHTSFGIDNQTLDFLNKYYDYTIGNDNCTSNNFVPLSNYSDYFVEVSS